MSEKKAIRRSEAIALVIICIILVVAGLLEAFVYYMPMINEKNNFIASLNSTYNDYVASHIHNNSEYLGLQIRLAQINSIVNLSAMVFWAELENVSQPASSYSTWIKSANYAGYISVWVAPTTTNNTYVRVIYSSHDVNYDNQISLGIGVVIPCFPVLPSSRIEIRVGNTNSINEATETVTIAYYY